MKVAGSSSISFTTTNTTPIAAPYRVGDVVVVQAVRVQHITNSRSDVLLKFPNGDLLTTVLKERFGRKEGDFFSIRIQGIDDNHIYARIISEADHRDIPRNETIDLFKSRNIANTNQNYEIVSQMLRSGLAPTSDNFNILLRYKNRYPKTPLEVIALLLKNGITVDERTVRVMEELMLHRGLIGERLFSLIGLIQNWDKDDHLKKLLKDFYKNPLDRNFNSSSIKVSQTIENLITIIDYLNTKESFAKQSRQALTAFLADLQASFAIALGRVLVLQIPINNNGLYDTAELFVSRYNDSRGYQREKFSVYIRIPTLNLGVVELLAIYDNSKSLQCHFQSQKNMSYMKVCVAGLYRTLADLGIRLTKVTFGKLSPDISIHNFEYYLDFLAGEKRFDERV